jgi:hypothetical protein
MNKLTWHLLTGACGLFAGVLISGGVKGLGEDAGNGWIDDSSQYLHYPFNR